MKLIPHAVDLLYHAAGQRLLATEACDSRPGRPVDICADCARPSGAWVAGQAYEHSQYGVTDTHCPACHSLYVGSIEHLGIESYRANGTKPVPAKLGMLTSAAGLVTAQGLTLFLPPGWVDKIGCPAQPIADIVPLSGRRALFEMFTRVQALAEPFLLIRDFGRKKRELVQNLRVSTRPEQAWVCDANGAESINIPLVMRLRAELAALPLPKPTAKAFFELMRGIAFGTRPLPARIRQTDGSSRDNDARAFFVANPQLAPLAAQLPIDPYERLATLAILQTPEE